MAARANAWNHGARLDLLLGCEDVVAAVREDAALRTLSFQRFVAAEAERKEREGDVATAEELGELLGRVLYAADVLADEGEALQPPPAALPGGAAEGAAPGGEDDAALERHVDARWAALAARADAAADLLPEANAAMRRRSAEGLLSGRKAVEVEGRQPETAPSAAERILHVLVDLAAEEAGAPGAEAAFEERLDDALTPAEEGAEAGEEDELLSTTARDLLAAADARAAGPDAPEAGSPAAAALGALRTSLRRRALAAWSEAGA